jgi:hypothetical protein
VSATAVAAGSTYEVASRLMARRVRPLPELVAVRMKQSILKWAGVTLAGSSEP